MIKKIIRFLAIGFAALVLLVVVLAIALPFLIPVEKIKSYAAQKAGEFLERPVTVEKASFNLFKGIELTGIRVGERSGFSEEPFLAADSAELRANLFKLIFGNLSVEGIKLVHPRIKIERNPDSLSNYQDILDRLKGAKEEPAKKELDLAVKIVEVKNGEFKLIAHSKGAPDQVKAFRNTDLTLKDFSLAMKGAPLSVKTVYSSDSGAGVPLGLEGRLLLDQKAEKVALYNLILDVDKEKLFGNFELAGFSGLQRFTFDLAADQLDVEKLAAIFSAGGTGQAQQAPAKAKPLVIDLPKTIVLDGQINLNKVKWGENTMDKLKITVRVADQKAALTLNEVNYKGNTLTGLLQGDFTRPAEPRLYARLESGKLDLNSLMGVKAEPAKKSAEGELTRSVNQAAARLPENLKLQAQVNLANVNFKKFNMDRLAGDFTLSNKILSGYVNAGGYQGSISMNPYVDFRVPGLAYSLDKVTLNGLESQSFINDLVESVMVPPEKNREFKDRFSGKISGSFTFKGSGVEGKGMISNLQGSGKVTVANGVLKKLKALESVAPLLNNDVLKGDIAFSELRGDFALSGGIVTVSALTANAEQAGMRAEFGGKADLLAQKYVAGNNLNLKLSPQNTTKIPPAYNIFRDKATGWSSLDFELTGALSKPIPVPKLGEAPAVKQEKERIQKEIDKQVETEKQRLEKEAEKKLKELFKF